MPTVVFGIPSGQTARDILHSGVLRRIADTPDVKVVVLTTAHEDADLCSFLEKLGAVVEPLPKYTPSPLERALHCASLATLRNHSRTIGDHLRRGSVKGMRLALPLVWLAERLLGRHRLLQTLNRLLGRCGGTPNCLSSVMKHRPDLIVLTRIFHWSADYHLLKAATAADIPAVALVSSWDNLTSKGFFPYGVEDVVVWNEVLRDEAIELFGFPKEHIHICGIPRYDMYFQDKGLRSREEFCAHWRLDPNRRLITFTTGNKGLMAHPSGVHPEVEVAKFLASAIERDAFGHPAQLLVRLHPLADPTPYEPLRQLRDTRLQIPGRNSAFGDRLLDHHEERDLAETMRHSDVVINHASTITIDAAAFDTPVVCVGFDWMPDQPYLNSTRRFYSQDHYHKLATTGGFHLATSRDALLASVRAYLVDPSRDRLGRAAIVKQQCQFSDGRSAERVADFLLDKLGACSHGVRSAA